MCFWYDFNTTQAHLESRGATAHIVQCTLSQVVDLKDLDEIKRYSLGLTNMLTAPVCQALSDNYTNIIKALSFLAQSSVRIRDKNKEKKNRGDQAEVEEEVGVMCEDEDDCGIDLDSEDEDDEAYDINNEEQECQALYLCPLDEVDEILYLGSWLQALQAQSPDFYNFLMSQIAAEPNGIENFNATMQYATLEQQSRQQGQL